jgi:tRNA nucleotidyltransferase (CCA-adding enzyme)
VPDLRDTSEVLQALLAWPGGPQLLALAGEREDVALVGGAVRDLLLGCAPRELDVVVAGDAASLARELADRLGASAVQHERFGTAVVEWEAGRIDIAGRRAEAYAAPGALPDVRPGTIEEDLGRRDFTVNAIAVPLAGPRRGEAIAAEGALEDLRAGRLRVLHERSFLDDPTRLLRLARYRARLGFTVEPHTAELASRAVGDGALAAVSRARVGAELRLALDETAAIAVLEATDELGVLGALHPRLRFDAQLARAALDVAASAPGDTRLGVLLLAVLLAPIELAQDPAAPRRARSEMHALLDAMEFTAAERDPAIDAVTGAEALAAGLAGASTRSQLYEQASHATLEGVALAGAEGERMLALEGAGDAARAWLADVRHVRLLIAGEDLLAAGVPEGPEVGQRLRTALLRKLDGQLRADDSDGELRAALEAQV